MNWGLIGIGAAIAFAAIGSALGTGTAGMAAVGAWKKCFAQNRPAPFILVAFVGFPLSQTIYGYLLMNRLAQAFGTGTDAGYLLGAGVLGGIAYASPWKLRGSYGWTCEVTVYVRAGHERQGLGRALSKRMLEILEKQGYRSIVAVIALPNDASVALHRSLGYELAGTLKNLGFKLDEWRDVSFWQVNFGDPDAPPSDIKPVSEVA